MKKVIFSLAMSLFCTAAFAQIDYRDMMDDNSYNVYDVIKAGEAYFKTHPTGKGSGYKEFQRWIQINEPRFYPSGDRSSFDPAIVAREFRSFKSRYGSNRLSGTGWEELGPAYAANYLPPTWASGVGRVEAVWADTVSGDTVYIGARAGGFWKSLDGGASWHSTTQDLAAVGVIDIDVHPTKHNEVYILTRNPAGYSQGLMKSTDYGETWASTSLMTSTLYKMIIPKSAPDTMYVSSSGGFYRSVDEGATWINTLSGSVRDFAVKPGSPKRVYLIQRSDNDQILVSNDHGATFAPLSNISANGGASSRIRVSAAAPNILYFQSSNGVWRSTDSGVTFSYQGAVPANMAFGVNDQNPDVLVSGGLDQYVSWDAGLNYTLTCGWVTPTAANYVHADGRVLESWNGVMYLGTDGYLGKSTDFGNSWNIVNPVGTPIREFYRIGIGLTDVDVMVGGSQDNGTSAYLHGTWYEWLGADGMECHIDRNNTNQWFGTIQFGALRTTDQNGQNSSGIDPAGTSGSWVTPSVLDPCNDNTIFIAFDTVYKSTDNGTNWAPLADFSAYGNMNQIAISPVDSNLLYVSKGSRIWHSTDNGNTWSDISSGLPNKTINRIATHPHDPQTVTVCFSGFTAADKVYTSTNAGGSWANITDNLPNMSANVILYENCPEERIYVGMDIGVYYRDNTTPLWVLYNDSLPDVEVTDLEINLGAHRLVASTWGRGAWCTDLVGSTTEPAIIRVGIDPLPGSNRPNGSDSVAVAARIEDDGTITEAKLFWGLDGLTFPNVINMTGVVADSFATVSKIQPHAAGTNVYFRLMAVDNTNDTTWTDKIVYRTKEPVLCEATGSAGTGSDYIIKVQLSPAGFTHVTGQDYYGDFRTYFYPEYERDSTYDITVQLGYHWDQDTVFTWIDWDNNLTFTEDERIPMSMLDGTHSSIGTFTVPSTAVQDTLVLRTRNIYDSNPPADPCNSYFGEVEDYSIVIKGPLLGIDDNEPAFLKAYPVPARDHMVLEYPGISTAKISIYDLMGKEVSAKVTNESSDRVVVNVNGLSEGVYFVRMHKADRIQQVKVLIGE